jgi:hypothetical protein
MPKKTNPKPANICILNLKTQTPVLISEMQKHINHTPTNMCILNSRTWAPILIIKTQKNTNHTPACIYMLDIKTWAPLQHNTQIQDEVDKKLMIKTEKNMLILNLQKHLDPKTSKIRAQFQHKHMLILKAQIHRCTVMFPIKTFSDIFFLRRS